MPKVIEQVGISEKITNDGDLTITGSVAANARIIVSGGVLIINGNVDSRAHIIVRKAGVSPTNRHGFYGYGAVVRTGTETIISGYEGLGVERVKGGIVSEYETQIGETTKIHSKGACIDGRIYTDNDVNEYKDKIYEIKADTPETNVSVRIGSRTYEGNNIRIQMQENLMIIDGTEISLAPDSLAASSSDESPSLEPGSIRIDGTVSDKVRIEADGAIHVNNVGNNCYMKSEHSDVNAKNLGEETEISAHQEVTIECTGINCRLNSLSGGISAHNLADEAYVQAFKDIVLKDIGNNCIINSDTGSITAQTAGQQLELSAKQDVVLLSVGDDSKVHTEGAIKINTYNPESVELISSTGDIQPSSSVLSDDSSSSSCSLRF